MDAQTADQVLVTTTLSSVVYWHPPTAFRFEVPTIKEPRAGGKPIAKHAIDPRKFNGLISSCRFGGGAYNQAKRIAAWGSRRADTDVTLCDSAAYDRELDEDCTSAGIQFFALDAHARPVNMVSPFQGDKLIVRSPFVPTGCEVREAVLQQAANAEVFVLVSPKDARTARQLWDAASGARRYVQPTGSLPASCTRELVRNADAMACNTAELCLLAQSLDGGGPPPKISEAAPDATVRIVELLQGLYDAGRVRCRVAAITLGAQGVVVFDTTAQRAFAVQVRLLGAGPGVHTPSGAGDFWHAEWICARELAGLDEPRAAVQATQAVAIGIGLEPDRFRIEVAELDVPALQLA